MSHRLQVLIPKELEARIRKAVQRCGVSKGEWVRRAIGEALDRAAGSGATEVDPLARMAALAAPTADIEPMLAEIGSGRR